MAQCPCACKSDPEAKCKITMTPACDSTCEIEPEIEVEICEKMTPICPFTCCPPPPCGRPGCKTNKPCPLCCNHAKSKGGVKDDEKGVKDDEKGGKESRVREKSVKASTKEKGCGCPFAK